MIGFWIALGIFTIIFVPFGALVNKWTGAFIGLIIAIVISGLLTLDALGKVERWNNGVCTECGGAYKFEGASKSRSGNETLYYVCEDCDNLIRQ